MRRREKRKMLFTVLFLLFLGIGIGYAALYTNLSIDGSSTMIGGSWDIHFENVVLNPDNVALSTGDQNATIGGTDSTTVSYIITLQEPGDFYEFTVDLKNDGTIDGMIETVTTKLNGVEITSSNQLPAYLEYSATYADMTPIEDNHLLEAGHTETYRIRVGFKTDINPEDLPGPNVSNSLSFGTSMVQATSAAIPKPQVVNYVYTLSSTDIYLGAPIPEGVTTYSTLAEVTQATGYQYALKHAIVNNIVTGNYIEFEITEEMANNSPGSTPGIYSTRGGEATINGELGEYYPDSPYFADNRLTLLSAFGASNCYDHPGTYADIGCAITDLTSDSFATGYAGVMGTNSYTCRVANDGSAKCS